MTGQIKKPFNEIFQVFMIPISIASVIVPTTLIYYLSSLNVIQSLGVVLLIFLFCAVMFVLLVISSVVFEFSEKEKETMVFAERIIQNGVHSIKKDQVYRSDGISNVLEVNSNSGEKKDWDKRAFKQGHSLYWDMVTNNGKTMVFLFWMVNHRRFKNAAKVIESYMVLEEMK